MSKSDAASGLQTIGEAFLIQRNRLKKELREIEKESGVSGLTISKIERGLLDNTSLDTLFKIAGALGMELNISVDIKEIEDEKNT